MSLRSPIRRVIGLGAAKEGASHWWAQRVSSVALVVLTLWFVACLMRFPDLDHVTLVSWMSGPVNAVLLVLLVATAVYHSKLGVQVVIEDYVPSHGLKIASLLLIDFIHVALGASGVFAVLRVAFGGAA
jgi:succinate dehydrogenase / fumarate reductase membrane anchor subunit